MHIGEWLKHTRFVEDEYRAKLLSLKGGSKMKAVYVDTKAQLDMVRMAQAGGFCREVGASASDSFQATALCIQQRVICLRFVEVVSKYVAVMPYLSYVLYSTNALSSQTARKRNAVVVTWEARHPVFLDHMLQHSNVRFCCLLLLALVRPWLLSRCQERTGGGTKPKSRPNSSLCVFSRTEGSRATWPT